MKMKWIKGSDKSIHTITDFVSSVSWAGSASQASRSLDISMINSPNDKNIPDLSIKPGDRIKFYSDDNKLLINAKVYDRERSSEIGTVTYSGMDDLNHLLKSNGTYNFKNITPEEITAKICNELQIKIGNIAVTNVNIKSLPIDSIAYYNIIMRAYTKAHYSNGKNYMPFMYDDKLFIIEKGEIVDNFVLNDRFNILQSSYKESLSSMVNRVRIYNDTGEQIGEVKNQDWINAYGIFQDSYKKEEGVNATEAAKKKLIGINKTASIEALGNIYCISGYGVKIKDKVTGLTGIFWIEGDTHTWENGKHTMSLDLAFKNIMDIQEG
jgi:plastocyanin